MTRSDTIKARRWLFVATILTGSFLLFLVQPLVARMALPRLGGAPAVWNSAMLVYQALLLGGYAYAHGLSRFTVRRQSIIHLALLTLAGLTLPIALADLAPPLPGWEPVWVPLLFAMTIGPVFFVVSAQAPLIQRWYAASPEAGDPYWLYAASNVGSFAGLIAYPLLLEPRLPLISQSLAWTAGYAVLFALVAVAAWSRWSVTDKATISFEGNETEPVGREAIGAKRILMWLVLAAVPSGLMLSTTTHLTTDIVAMPLLWVIPLSLYLLSYTFAFNENSIVARVLTRIAPLLLLVTGGMAMVSRGADTMVSALATLLFLFTLAVTLHRRLYQDRPPAQQLTLFYLVMSAGGALGGLFTALIAPLMFDWVWEHALLVLAAAAILSDRPLFNWLDRFNVPFARRGITIALILVFAVLLSVQLYQALAAENDILALVLGLGVVITGLLLLGNRIAFVLALVALMLGRGGIETLSSSLDGARERSFFGIYAVREDEGAKTKRLTHGTTLHGLQFTDPTKELEPTTYYSGSSGVGMVLERSKQLVGPNARVGVVGLGVGTLACYRQPDEVYEFFEIDPTILDYSDDGRFTFMQKCAPNATTYIGDARLVLEEMEAGRFDILVIDAFSSDAIPIHLVTTEAFAIYRRSLSDDGVLLVHISNRFMDLAPMIASLADANGLEARIRADLDEPEPGTRTSRWVALSGNEAQLALLEASGEPGTWEALPAPAARVWTDDFASVLPLIKWDALTGKSHD